MELPIDMGILQNLRIHQQICIVCACLLIYACSCYAFGLQWMITGLCTARMPLDEGDEMKEDDRPLSEIEALRSRLSRLSRASLRITEDLDLGVALREIADEARSLTGASYAVIATFGMSGEAEDFTASGLSTREARRLWEIPGGLRFFEYLSSLPESLRVAAFAEHARSMGLPDRFSPLPSATAAWAWATSTSRKANPARSSLSRMRRRWCCSVRSPHWSSPMPAGSGTSDGSGRTSRR